MRSVLAETGDRAIDEAGAFRLQARVVELELGEPAYLEIFDQHVRARRQLAHNAAAVLALEIDLDRTLPTVGAMEIGRADRLAVHAFNKRRAPAARIVAGPFALDLDHVGTQIGEDLARPGAGQNAGKFKNADARERLRHG